MTLPSREMAVAHATMVGMTHRPPVPSADCELCAAVTAYRLWPGPVQKEQDRLVYLRDHVIRIIATSDDPNVRPDPNCHTCVEATEAGVWAAWNIEGPVAPPMPENPTCHADRDGDCNWTLCPQKVTYLTACPLPDLPGPFDGYYDEDR